MKYVDRLFRAGDCVRSFWGQGVADPVVADERMVGEGDRPLEFESVAKGDSMFRDLVLVRIVAAVKMSGLSRFGEKWRAAAS